jgi:hypothetical protein
MTHPSPQKSPKNIYQSVITISKPELKAIFGDQDIVRLEYPADEFPRPETRIIVIFSQQSGRQPQYIELQEWLDLLEDYREKQQEAHFFSLENGPQKHEEDFVCVISFRIDGDDDSVGEVVVSPADRDDCINAILQKYPNEHLDFSIEFVCKQCLEENFIEESEIWNYGTYGGSQMIH